MSDKGQTSSKHQKSTGEKKKRKSGWISKNSSGVNRNLSKVEDTTIYERRPDETYERSIMKEKIGILALGHGSRHPHNKDVVNGVANLIAKKYDNVVVRIGFMNMNTPTMKEGLEAFKGTGVSTIVAVPIFLAHGVHTMEDIPQILGISRDSRKTMVNIDGKNIPLIYSEPLGIDELVAELAFKRAQEALASN